MHSKVSLFRSGLIGKFGYIKDKRFCDVEELNVLFQRFVKFFRGVFQKKHLEEERPVQEIDRFHTWDFGVKEPISRREIYEDWLDHKFPPIEGREAEE